MKNYCEKILEIAIPVRQNAPETTLRVRLVYEVYEEAACLASKPYTFMLPGGPGANHSYYKDYDCLKAVTNLVYYNPRGCGLSDQGERATYTMDNYLDDLHRDDELINQSPLVRAVYK